MFRCLVALLLMHACFGPRHERDSYTSHTRATANRWGEDDSLSMSESNDVFIFQLEHSDQPSTYLYQSSSIIIPNAPRTTRITVGSFTNIL